MFNIDGSGSVRIFQNSAGLFIQNSTPSVLTNYFSWIQPTATGMNLNVWNNVSAYENAIGLSYTGITNYLATTFSNAVTATSIKCTSIDITSGSNTKTGSGTLSGGTVTIANTSVTANSFIYLTPTSSSSTTSGVLAVTSKIAGTSFTVKSSNALDVATFVYLIIETA